jgi:hypothetical protein
VVLTGAAPRLAARHPTLDRPGGWLGALVACSTKKKLIG